MTKQYSKGLKIGYGGTSRLKRNSVLGVVQCGHSDGAFVGYSDQCSGLLTRLKQLVPAKHKNLPHAYLGNSFIPLIGKAGMSHMMLDITGSDYAIGDTVKIPVNPLLVQSHIERRIIN